MSEIGDVFWLSVVIGWTVGLMPPLLIRYVFIRRPLDTGPALGVLAVEWIAIVVGSGVAQIEVNHGALFLLMLAAFWILKSGRVPIGLSEKGASIDTQQENVEESGFHSAQGAQQSNARFESEQSTDLEQNDEELYLIANTEVEEERQKNAIWIKALTLAEGDESTARYRYVKMRVEQLLKERQNPTAEDRARALGLSKEDYEYLGHPIRLFDYLQKYREKRSRVDYAIKLGKLKAAYSNGALWVQDKKIR